MPSSPSSPAFEPTLDIARIRAAADRLAGHALRTPLLESRLLNERLGGRLLIKAEGLQRTGSFKFRGAFNRLSVLDKAARARGVVAFSSGNHAQGVAAAAEILGIHAAIVMPGDAPRLKIQNTRDYGAEVVLYDRVKEDRRQIATTIAGDRNATLVPPYDDHEIMAGQGTVGLEIGEQLNAAAMQADAVLIPCSGGGLTAGVATAIRALSPATQVYTVEPDGFDDTARSLRGGERCHNEGAEAGLCDALLARTPGELTFAIMRGLVAGGFSVADQSALRAMATAFRHFKVVLEPSGAIALGAILAGTFDIRNKTVVIIGSGANVDPETYRHALNSFDS
ncbi:MAG: threonine/serine dehydratase [Alphaproteobacteria bacterium]|nr:threonine/serine dehydratase [Alphaproteobacteria bacterium]